MQNNVLKYVPDKYMHKITHSKNTYKKQELLKNSSGKLNLILEKNWLENCNTEQAKHVPEIVNYENFVLTTKAIEAETFRSKLQKQELNFSDIKNAIDIYHNTFANWNNFEKQYIIISNKQFETLVYNWHPVAINHFITSILKSYIESVLNTYCSLEEYKYYYPKIISYLATFESALNSDYKHRFINAQYDIVNDLYARFDVEKMPKNFLYRYGTKGHGDFNLNNILLNRENIFFIDGDVDIREKCDIFYTYDTYFDMIKLYSDIKHETINNPNTLTDHMFFSYVNKIADKTLDYLTSKYYYNSEIFNKFTILFTFTNFDLALKNNTFQKNVITSILNKWFN